MRSFAWISIAGALALGGCGDDLPNALGDGSSGTATTAVDTTGGSTAGDTTEGEASDSTGEDDDLDEFPGLSAPVEIIIDDQGIPHVYGQTDLDAMYGAGYQQATDRLFQMDLMRRRAMGRQAEVLGERKRGQDELSLLFDIPRWGAANAQRLRDESPQTYRLVVAWLAGVNDRIAEVNAGDVPLPYGFGPNEANYMPEPLTMAEHSAIAKLMMLGNSNSLERELLATIVQRSFPEAWDRIELPRPAFYVPTMPPDELPAPAPLRPGVAPTPKPPIPATPEQIAEAMAHLRESMAHVPRVGSNNWAVSGVHTASGRPLIAGDPHQPLDSPSVMYTQHINSADAGGTLDVIGWAFAGSGGVQLGHNRNVHWTATTNFADVMDIWEVELDGSMAKIGDEWLEIESRTETIVIADGDDVEYVVQEIPGYGVILPNELVPLPIAAPGNALLLNWTGFAATNEERTFMEMATATSVAEYEAAADLMEVGGFNFVAADAQDITYRVQINVPDRGDTSARQMPTVVVDGNDAGSFWTGEFLAPQQLPRSHGGARGWVASANNDPWGFTFDGDLSNDPWYYGSFFAAGHRAQRIDEELTRLTARGQLDLADMQALQSDTHSPLADVVLPMLDQTWLELLTDPELEPYRDRPELLTLYTVLSTWDRQMERDRPGALAFHFYIMLLTEEVTRDELSLLYPTVLGAESPFVIKFPVLALLGEYPNSDDLLGDSRNVVLMRTLARVADDLEDRFGSVDPTAYTWADLHGTEFRSPIDGELYGGWWPTDGGEDTVNVSASAFMDDMGVPMERFNSHSGAVFRVVTEFAEDGTPQAYANFPPGNSADPQSPHFDDTRDAWIEDEYRRLPFTRDEVEAAAEATVVLEP